jgi:hypothetical protein
MFVGYTMCEPVTGCDSSPLSADSSTWDPSIEQPKSMFQFRAVHVRGPRCEPDTRTLSLSVASRLEALWHPGDSMKGVDRVDNEPSTICS